MKNAYARTALGATLFALMCIPACSSSVADSTSSGFSVTKDGFSFENFGGQSSTSSLSTDELIRMFGAKAVCVDERTPCNVKPGAAVWARSVNDALEEGRCEGFAVLSQLFFMGALSPADFGADATFGLQIASNEKLGKELAFWFSSQMAGSVIGGKTKKFYAKDVMPFLSDILTPGQEETYRLGIMNKNGGVLSGGHALTPIGYDKVGDGLYMLRVYDNNVPGTERTLEINTVANRWSYVGSLNPSDSASVYFGDEKNRNPMCFAPVRARVGTFACKFCNKGESGQVVASSNGNVSVSDGAGNSVAAKNGEISAEGGATVDSSFNFALAGKALFSAELPSAGGALQVTSDAAQSTISVATSDRAAFLKVHGTSERDASGVSMAPHVELKLDTTGVSIKGDTNASANVALSRTLANSDGTTRVVSVDVAAPTGASVSANIDDSGKVSTTVTGGEGSVTLQLSQVDGDKQGSGTFSVPVGAEQGGSTSITSAMPANANEPMVATSTNGNGQVAPVADMCRDGVRNGSETDLDCGGTCAGCAVDQVCAVGADCTSGACHSTTKRCVVNPCADGQKNGDESDVDCGGSCAKCGDGSRCSAPSDCAGAACTANVCGAGNTCNNGIKDGSETDTDCGGLCGPCGTGMHCSKAADCTTGLCPNVQQTCIDRGPNKLVFTTSAGLTIPQVGSLAQADAKCDALATSAGLPGTYKALLSDGNTSAISRLVAPAGGFSRVDGTVVSGSFFDFYSETHLAPMNVDENGAPIHSEVWTATDTLGGYSGGSCANWSSSVSASLPAVGNSDQTTGAWVNVNTQTCNQTCALYCIEQ